jgi:Ser/Thr protein kinase RdoA (MazF antagonist)
MDIPYFEPDEAVRRAVSERHRLVGDWEALGPRGQVHSVFRVGDAVVRIPRDDPEWISDTLTEMATLRGLAGTGFPTPALRGFDDALDLIPVPYCVVDFFDGSPHEDWTVEPRVLQGVGDALAWLHSEVKELPDPNGWLDWVEMEDARSSLQGAILINTITPEESAWCAAILDRLEPLLDQDLQRVFVHNDVHELNILASPTQTMLIDWGDAGWGDPCFDFSVLPPPWIPAVFAVYERQRPLPEPVRARVVWNQLGKALRRLAGPEDRHWNGRRRLELMRDHLPAICSE